MEGGSCNDYDYVCGDPVNGLDLNGLKKAARPLPDGWSEPDGVCGYRQINEVFYSDLCSNYRAAERVEDSSIFWDYVENGIDYYAPQGPIEGWECPGWLVSGAQFLGLGGVGRGVRDRQFDEIEDNAKSTAMVPLQKMPAIGVTAVATAVDFGCTI